MYPSVETLTLDAMAEGALTAAGEQLGYQREIFINPAVTRQWVSIKVFSLPKYVDDRTALTMMIDNARYRDSYAGTADKDMVAIHGPYWLSAIAPDTVVVADADVTNTLIRTWAGYYAPWPEAEREAMDREVYSRIAAATSLYELPNIRATAQHDWGEVVGGDGFHEFVAINRNNAELALIVASDD